MVLKDFRDFVLFECLASLIAAHALLSTSGTPMRDEVIFYLVLLLMNFMSLILIRQHYQEQGQLLDYNENLTDKALSYILLGTTGVFFFSVIISRPWTSSVIHVPTFAVTLSTFNLESFCFALLYNFGLIANAEETTKLVGHNTIYMYLQSQWHAKWAEREKWAKGIAATVPVLFWASLHAYIAYIGPILWQLVLAAFVAGLIMFYVIWKTMSLLAAIAVHGLYNVIVLTAYGMGLLTVALIPLLCYSAFNLLMIVAVKRGSKNWM
ncbi:MAG: CPBP family intramembrane metalloprotease [Candidatus Bathyarchaeota archaeon]|nr:CPBP family intramembrane metalloprotease [Candidatus Bathyarchaeota archaeon]